jgi:NADH dehydrogenase
MRKGDPMSAMLAEPAEKLAVADAPHTEQTRAQKRIVIIGGGFAGIAAARALKRADAEVVLIDRRNHHIFQPLLYMLPSYFGHDSLPGTRQVSKA